MSIEDACSIRVTSDDAVATNGQAPPPKHDGRMREHFESGLAGETDRNIESIVRIFLSEARDIRTSFAARPSFIGANDKSTLWTP